MARKTRLRDAPARRVRRRRARPRAVVVDARAEEFPTAGGLLADVAGGCGAASRRSRRRDRARASSPWPREAPPRRGRGAGRGPPRSRARERALALEETRGVRGGVSALHGLARRRGAPASVRPRRGRRRRRTRTRLSLAGARVCAPVAALARTRAREPARRQKVPRRRTRGSIRVGSAVASRDAPARDHAPSARGIFKRASPPRRFEDPAASAPPAMKNTRECGDAKAGNPSAAGVDIRRFIGRNRRFTFDRSVLEPRQSKKFFAKAPSNFPRSPNPGITWLSSDRERIHIGEIFAFSPFSRTQHSTVQLSARALRPIRFVWGAQSSGLS